MDRIELPMNKDGFIRSNVSRASLFAVLTSEEYAGELNAVISKFVLGVSGNEFIYGSESRFKENIKDLSVIVDDKSGQIKISSHPYRENKYAYIYKNIISGENLFVETKIDYIQDSNALSTIKLVLSDGLNYNKSGSLHQFTTF